MRKIINKRHYTKLLLLLLGWILTFNALASYQAGSKLMAHWPLDVNDKSTFIKDNTGTYNLNKQASVEKGTWSGFSSSYLPSLDMRNLPWVFEGNFQTTNEDGNIAVIAGTRSALSGYTGWDFLMLKDGTLRVMAVNNDKKGVSLMSSGRSFNDGKIHFFSLEWSPDGGKGTITLVIDRKHKYSVAGIGDLGENSKRLFEIGCQAGNSSKSLLWIGKLQNFKFTGVPQASTTSSTETRIENLDAEMRTGKPVDLTVKWINATELNIEGKGWKDTETPYNRLPARFKSVVRNPVWALSTHSAGIALHFTASNTKFITAKWKLKSNPFLPHMTPLGVNGLDLYVKLNGKWQWAGVGKPTRSDVDNEASLKNGIPETGKYEYILYLPLYSALTDIQLGFSPDVKIEKPHDRGKPLVFYGTSILQGCSASRPGMAYPSMLGRRLDMPTINLGFSGNGTMDPEFADILAEISASAYIIDCLPNMGKMSSDEIVDRTLFLVRKLRAKRPETPIILVEDRTYAYANFTGAAVPNNRRAGLKKAYEQLLKENVKAVSYIPGEGLIGYDNEATVDGSHPTDLGMFRYCEVIEPVLRKILGK
ncbi:hypothetical protein FW774_04845 (plasmid) [Pedobacter sp. BS3]|uniref:SGNH/GDSL hydrolase family protein n=1 Tax=Pedobacter sp. BS3 TaxID=2567937 RepID=UPI0011EC78CA|nr:SGNH/GDSL hydrolase family protein [Pedobacter sp. BS3]TZF86376.1 hypothetical protein FW774_04845 [Pedobacter sp. BS3]